MSPAAEFPHQSSFRRATTRNRAVRSPTRRQHLDAGVAFFAARPREKLVMVLVVERIDSQHLAEVAAAAGQRAAAMVDISQLSSAELLSRLPIALLIVGADGLIVLASESAEEALNSDEPLVGQPLDGVLGPLDALLEASRADGSVSVPGARGRTLRFGFSISELARSGGPVSLYAIVFRDITQVAHVAVGRDRLEHLAAVGAAAPAVIHGIKSSLAAISLGMSVFAEDLRDPAQKEHAEALGAEAESVAIRLDALGAAGRPPRSRRAVDLARTLAEARRSLESRARTSGVQLQWDERNLAPVYLDPGLVHGFVQDLGLNAIQASSADGRVRVHVELEADTFILSIEDGGCGMTRDVRARCTELFFSTHGRGRGLGLTLCDQAVRAGGGSLEIESEPGRGTLVTVRFPRATEFAR